MSLELTIHHFFRLSNEAFEFFWRTTVAKGRLGYVLVGFSATEPAMQQVDDQGCRGLMLRLADGWGQVSLPATPLASDCSAAAARA